MAGKRGFRSYPRHLGRPTGRGIKECQATGFLRPVGEQVSDYRQGLVAREFADLTPGFGTRHPQDVKQLGQTADPHPIKNARPKDMKNLSKQDLGYSDQEIEASIREGRQPRFGY